tara:strand:- start:648 stop:2300 length:1653 start_codon:yes stop_codon:yes gene_type:complete
MIKEKLNLPFISQYKTVFSEQLIAQAFKEKDMLTGKEILYISPIKQLNLFIIKSLFERWQEEIKRIESPYFDYHAPKVKVMISKFMNVLSQNISINAENLKPIIEKAVEDLIILNFDPATYLDNEIKRKPELLLNKKIIPQFSKYLVFHKSLILDFLDVFDTNDLKHLKSYAIDFFGTHSLGEHQLVEQLSEILILEKQELFQSIQSIKKNNEENLIVRELSSEPNQLKDQADETMHQLEPIEGQSVPKDSDNLSEVRSEINTPDVKLSDAHEGEIAAMLPDNFGMEAEENLPSPDNEDLLVPSTSGDQSSLDQQDDRKIVSAITKKDTDDLTPEGSVEEVDALEASPSNEGSLSTEEQDSTINIDYENEELERSTSDFSLETDSDVSMDKFQTLDEIDTDNGIKDEVDDFPLEDPIIEVYKNKKASVSASEALSDDLGYRKEPELSKLDFETINEQFQSETKTIADTHQEERITSILSNISINHQYMFVKELFGDSDEKFKATITKIEHLENFDAAVEHLIRNDAKEYQWDMNAEIVKELLKIIFRRFR